MRAEPLARPWRCDARSTPSARPIHSGAFDFFLIGDPAVHRELIVSGPAASRTAELEGLATAGQIAISAETASVLPPYAVRASSSGTLLLRRAPAGRRPTDTARGIPIPVGADPADVRGVGSGEVTMLLPPPVRAHLLAEAGEAEHRFIGVAFIQFSGTDALLAEHGPQAVAAAETVASPAAEERGDPVRPA